MLPVFPCCFFIFTLLQSFTLLSCHNVSTCLFLTSNCGVGSSVIPSIINRSFVDRSPNIHTLGHFICYWCFNKGQVMTFRSTFFSDLCLPFVPLFPSFLSLFLSLLSSFFLPSFFFLSFFSSSFFLLVRGHVLPFVTHPGLSFPIPLSCPPQVLPPVS